MSKRSRSEFSIGVSWVHHSRDMRESPAWRALPDEGRRVLDRLELEHMRHGGAENGNLICTTMQFHQEAGIRRSSVASAVRQCEALGFIQVSRFGYSRVRSVRPASLYRLTYLSSGRKPGRHAPTDEWKRVTDLDDAVQRLGDDGPTRRRNRTQVGAPNILPEIVERSPIFGSG